MRNDPLPAGHDHSWFQRAACDAGAIQKLGTCLPPKHRPQFVPFAWPVLKIPSSSAKLNPNLAAAVEREHRELLQLDSRTDADISSPHQNMAAPILRYLMPSLARRPAMPSIAAKATVPVIPRSFSTTPSPQATLNQVLKVRLHVHRPLAPHYTCQNAHADTPLPHRNAALVSARATPSPLPWPTPCVRNRKASASRSESHGPRSPTQASEKRRVCV